jgi:hypothetical protein
METDAAVDKITNFQFLSTAGWKSLLAFHTVPTGPAAINQQTTKPDRSLATKTGHFHLLPTGEVFVAQLDLSLLRTLLRSGWQYDFTTPLLV